MGWDRAVTWFVNNNGSVCLYEDTKRLLVYSGKHNTSSWLFYLQFCKYGDKMAISQQLGNNNNKNIILVR